MKDDDLYVRYQTLAALVAVLLHDLRNPLHSATLLVEAMGTRTADVDALRGKLRGQFGKLDGLIAEAADSIKELALEPRIAPIELDELFRLAGSIAPAVSGCDVELVPAAASGVRVAVDASLTAHAIGEIAGSLLERAQSGDDIPERARISLTVDRPETGVVRVYVGDWTPVDDLALKNPFAIAGGGVRLALARGLATVGGGTLRLEQSSDGKARFALHLKAA